MTSVVAFEPQHLAELLEEGAAAYLKPLLTPDVLESFRNRPLTHSIQQNGKVVFCGGVSLYYPGRGEAWAFFDSTCRQNFVPVFKIVKKWLNDCPVRRIEASVKVDDEQAHRWVRSLGFELEAPLLKAYRPDGADCALYSKVKHG